MSAFSRQELTIKAVFNSFSTLDIRFDQKKAISFEHERFSKGKAS
jgi:hypothetical protein